MIDVDFLTRSELSLGGVFSTDQKICYFRKATYHYRIDVDNCGPKAEYENVKMRLRLYPLARVQHPCQCGILSLGGQNRWTPCGSHSVVMSVIRNSHVHNDLSLLSYRVTLSHELCLSMRNSSIECILICEIERQE